MERVMKQFIEKMNSATMEGKVLEIAIKGEGFEVVYGCVPEAFAVSDTIILVSETFEFSIDKNKINDVNYSEDEDTYTLILPDCVYYFGFMN